MFDIFTTSGSSKFLLQFGCLYCFLIGHIGHILIVTVVYSWSPLVLSSKTDGWRLQLIMITGSTPVGGLGGSIDVRGRFFGARFAFH